MEFRALAEIAQSAVNDPAAKWLLTVLGFYLIQLWAACWRPLHADCI